MTEPLVRTIDHVFVPVADPGPLFDLFTTTLGLPVAWPIHDYGPFRSSGVCLGNANIEFVSGDPAVLRYFEPTEPLTTRGIGFEPAQDFVLEELDAREIPHSEEIRFEGTGAAGNSGHLWTNVYLHGLAGHAALVFLCRYAGEAPPRGAAARAALEACSGGVLGARGLAEVQIGCSDLENAEPLWRSFLAPATPDRYGLFRLPEGPAIRLRSSPMDGVSGLFIQVESLDAARDALRSLGLLGPSRRSGVGLDYASTGGLDVWLSEAR